MPENFASRYFLGQGKVFVGGRDAAGAPDNLVFAGDISSASMTPNIDTVETKENVTGQRATAVSIQTGVEYQLSIAFRSMKPEHAAVWMQGSNTVKAGASVTDEAVTASLGGFVPLAHVKVSSVVVTGAGGTPTYVADTDYKVHADEGLLEILDGGSITDGLALLVDYTYAAQHHVSANPANADKYIVFAGINTADNNKQTRVTIYKAKLDAGSMDLIQSDNTGEVTISGRVLIDTLRSAGDQLFSWKTED